MKPSIIIQILVILVCSCNYAKTKDPSNNSKQHPKVKKQQIINELTELNKQDSAVYEIKLNDTSLHKLQVIPIHQYKNAQKKQLDEKSVSYTRLIEFPGDNHFNGKPMIHQIEMTSKVLNNFTDTLSKLALTYYKTYDRYFPKAIADNFEDGISTEMVVYPKKLIFQFQIFQDENAANPYVIKEVIIRRNENREPYAE